MKDTLLEVKKQPNARVVSATPHRYTEYLASPHWQFIRKAMLWLGSHCHLCHSQQPPLDVHHASYDGYPYHEKPEDLVVLCRKCHERVHDRMEWVVDPTAESGVAL